MIALPWVAHLARLCWLARRSMGFIERQVNHVPRRRTQFVLLYIPFHGTTVTLAGQRLKVKIAESFASVGPTRSQYLRQLLSSTMVPADLSVRVATSSLGTGGKCKCFFDVLGTFPLHSWATPPKEAHISAQRLFDIRTARWLEHPTKPPSSLNALTSP